MYIGKHRNIYVYIFYAYKTIYKSSQQLQPSDVIIYMANNYISKKYNH